MPNSGGVYMPYKAYPSISSTKHQTPALTIMSSRMEEIAKLKVFENKRKHVMIIVFVTFHIA